MSETVVPRQHAANPAHPGTAPPPEPSHAERMRTLMLTRSAGTLSTWSARHPGFPFGSLMPYALDVAGRPILLISNMAMHTHNLRRDGRASLFVEQAIADGDALGAARGTIVGNVAPVPADDAVEVRALYLARHPNSRSWVEFADFGFFRLQPVEIYYVGGFGVMGWVSAEAYDAAAPDPLADEADGILAHMNADHVDAMLRLARRYAGIEASLAAMTSVDRLGFTLRLTTAAGMKGTRINFTREVKSASETRTVLVEMVRAAG